MLKNLKIKYSEGQVFMTWNEKGLLDGDVIRVYAAEKPILDIAEAVCIGRNIERCSAGDWWNDPASFVRNAVSRKNSGFVSPWGELSPEDGFFVHTVTADTLKKPYYAVCVIRDGVPICKLSSRNPSYQFISDIKPFYIGDGTEYAKNSAQGRPLYIHLHGRSAEPDDSSSNNVEYDNNYVVYGDGTMGWREGIAFKYKAEIHPELVFLRPVDRAYVGRPLLESKDQRDHVPAINTFWYGYPDNIFESNPKTQGTVVNYTQNRLLFLINWAVSYLGCDPDRVYITGGSMGGTGALALGYEFAHLFAAIHAAVPITRYSDVGGGNFYRLDGFCRNRAREMKTSEGISLIEHLDQVARVKSAQTDLPYVYMTGARQDKSVPWQNNPPFYSAAVNARQGISVYWNNGGHDMGADTPRDVAGWFDILRNYRLNQSFPVCTISDNKEYGNGEPGDGDKVGWLNRGVRFRIIRDECDSYAIELSINHPDIVYPVKVDVTLRRLRSFDFSEAAEACFCGESFLIHKDDKGNITVPGLCFKDDSLHILEIIPN